MGERNFLPPPIEEWQIIHNLAEENAQHEPTPEAVSAFESYILNGGLLIKQGRIKEAVEHFKNGAELAKVGVLLAPVKVFSVDAVSGSVDYNNLISMVASNSFSLSNKNGERRAREVKLAVLERPNSENVGEDLPIELLKEVALICMEEWLHVLQEFKGSLSGEEDREKDVSKYMEKSGISVTPIFQGRYDR